MQAVYFNVFVLSSLFRWAHQNIHAFSRVVHCFWGCFWRATWGSCWPPSRLCQLIVWIQECTWKQSWSTKEVCGYTTCAAWWITWTWSQLPVVLQQTGWWGGFLVQHHLPERTLPYLPCWCQVSKEFYCWMHSTMRTRAWAFYCMGHCAKSCHI